MARRIRNWAAGVTAVAMATVGWGWQGAGATGPDARGRGAKNVILMIGDGMGETHVDAARQRFHGVGGRLHMERMRALGSVSTYAVQEGTDVPEPVTDSASAATAWSSGEKTYNNALGKDSFGNVLPTLMEQADEAGMRTGNVTTSEITDATPAAMFSHVSARACQGPDFDEEACVREDSGQGADDLPVAEQIAGTTTADVILGGGLQRFEPEDQDSLEANGYEVLGDFGDPALEEQTAESQSVATGDDLAGVDGADRRVVGLFNRGNLTVETYKQDNPEAPEAAEPTLREMTEKAIELLSGSEEGQERGFLLQVEGALIDKRSHANDAAQTLEEMRAFDEAVAAARAFAATDGETLVVVTADHECAGFNIVAKESFTNAEAPVPPVNEDSGNPANSSTPLRPVPEEGQEIEADPARSAGPVNGAGAGEPINFAPATFRTPDDPEGVEDGDPEASLWLSYLSGNHTGADVNVYAEGPRSRRFDTQIDNTDIYRILRSSLRALNTR